MMPEGIRSRSFIFLLRHDGLQPHCDVGLTVFRHHLLAEEIGDIEGINDLFAEGGDPRGGDIQRQIGQHRRHVRQKAGTVKAFDLDDGEFVGKPVGNRHRRRDIEGLALLAALGPRRDDLGKPLLASQNLFDQLADIGGAAGSSSSIGNSRLIRIVSSARPSDVVKI